MGGDKKTQITESVMPNERISTNKGAVPGSSWLMLECERIKKANPEREPEIMAVGGGHAIFANMVGVVFLNTSKPSTMYQK